VAKEAPQQPRPATQASALAGHVLLDLVDGVWSEVREAAVLEVAPQQLHRVEVGRVGRKPDDLPARMCGQPCAHELVFVRVAAIPHEDDGTPHLAREVAEKPQDLWPPDVESWIQGQGQGDLLTVRRHDERANAGHLFMRAGAHRERRRGAAWRPRTAEYRQHQKAGFIEADQVSAPAREFFLPGPSLAGPTRAHGDRRALSRAAEGAAD